MGFQGTQADALLTSAASQVGSTESHCLLPGEELGHHRDKGGRLDPVGGDCRVTWLRGPWAMSHCEGMLGWMCLSHRVQDGGCL